MATAKPSTTKKKPVAKKAAPKASAKKAPAKKSATSKVKQQPVRSFKLSRESEKFISARISRQTVYWAILAIFILVVGVYIINIQLEILDTLNQISQG